jgi:hypothetical protein
MLVLTDIFGFGEAFGTGQRRDAYQKAGDRDAAQAL